jgi:putative flippase GtrA
MNQEASMNSSDQAVMGLPAPLFRLAREFLGYLLVGGLAFAVDYGVLWLCLSLGLHYVAATLLGFAAGLATNYLLCISWVWRGTQATTLRDFINFSLIGIGGLLLTLALMWLAVDIARLTPTLAKPFIAGIVLVWNFGLRRLFVFFR